MDRINGVTVWEIVKGDSTALLYENHLGTYIRGTEKLKRFVGKPMKQVLDYLLNRDCICTVVDTDASIAR